MGLTDDRISELEDRLVEFANLNNRENIHFKKLNLRDVWGKHIRPNICAIGVAKSRTRLSDFTFTHRRRKWQPTPVFLPGESQGRGSLVGCRLWGHTGSDMTEAT